jgi:hypothetical protein
LAKQPFARRRRTPWRKTRRRTLGQQRLSFNKFRHHEQLLPIYKLQQSGANHQHIDFHV